jgi:hypothetical protein
MNVNEGNSKIRLPKHLNHGVKVLYERYDAPPVKVVVDTVDPVLMLWTAAKLEHNVELPFYEEFIKKYNSNSLMSAILVLREFGVQAFVHSRGEIFTTSISDKSVHIKVEDRAFFVEDWSDGSAFLGFYNGIKVLLPVYPVNYEVMENDENPTQHPFVWNENTEDIDDIFLFDKALFDAGGTGDCLLRALNHLLLQYTNFSIVPIQKWYDMWKLPRNEFLEDPHLNDFAWHYNILVVAVARVNGITNVQCYGPPDSEIALAVYNDYPRHFYAIGPVPDSESAPSSSLENNNMNPMLPDRATFSNICSFMANSKFFKFTNHSFLLDSFAALHYEVVLILDALSKENKTPIPSFFKLYYKFRHNVFGYLCKLSLGIDDFFDTDVPLSKYIESNKTPDLILESDNEINIIEFTVSNRYDTADYFKGGGNRNVKYSEESTRVEEKTGKSTKVHIIQAILDQVNVNEIYDLVLNLGGVINTESLDYFFEISNNYRSVINSSQINAEYTVNIPRLETDLKEFERPELSDTLMVPSEMLISLMSSVDKFKNNTMLINRYRGKNVQPVYDISLGTLHLESFSGKDKKFKGTPISDFVLGILSGGLPFLIKKLCLKNDGKLSNWSQVRGTVPVTLSLPKNSFTIKLPKVHIGSDNCYMSTEKIEGEYEELWDKGYIKTGSSNRVFFPKDYFEKLSTVDFKIVHSKNKSLLGNCQFTNENADACKKIFDEQMILSNEVPSFIKKPKCTFMTPMPNDFSASSDPVICRMLSLMLSATSGYTNRAVFLAIEGRFHTTKDRTVLTQNMLKAKNTLNEANSRLFQKKKNLGLMSKKYSFLSLAEKKLILNEKKSANEAAYAYSRTLSELKGTRAEHLVRISRGKKSKWAHEFKQEMSHYRQDKATYKGVGLIDETEGICVSNFFDNLLNYLMSKQTENTLPLFNHRRSVGPELLNKLKNKYSERADDFSEKFFQNTALDHLTRLISSVAIHLFNESTKSYGSEFVKMENLGYDNFFIMVRGGAKIYKNQRSRLYRLATVMDNEWVKYFGYAENPDYIVKNLGSETLIITPWSQMHQDVMFDYMSIRHRTFMNLFSSYTRSCPNMDQDLSKLHLLPFLLSWHNRRKTEVFMHNSRYLIVNPLGRHANVEGIIPSFAGFNYTYFDGWLRFRLSTQYAQFSKKLILSRNVKNNIDSILSVANLTDIWLGTSLLNADQLTSFIYVTYMMTKSAVNSSVEQANNLWEILADVKLFKEVHPDVNGLKDHSLRFDILKDGDEVYDDDFKYDPVFCNYLGHHLVSYLRNNIRPSELRNYWETLKDSDIDRIANSNGLRGWNEGNFFNKKGYQVCYEKVDELLQDVDLNSCVESYLSSDFSTSRNMIKSDCFHTSDVITEKDLIFHVVHKIQRGGGREIFCMDLNTKAQQNPFEKMFKLICKQLPNEFISIPSNKRHGLIHTDFYEKKINQETKVVLRWVLDCRRWAPHSVFQKYVYFVEGLAPMLPADFVNSFRDFSEKMFKKRFLTRKHVFEKMKNNVRFQEYKDLMKVSDVIADAYEMTVNFSFVMGIFNYLSTLLHAANQLVSSEVIRNQCLMRGEGLVIMDPKCHSDDSVVSSYHTSESSTRRSIILYDWLLKGANHMLSIKKSQINDDVYLEFLSVLYMYDRFLPVLPKFASSMPFKPSDKGYSSDISFAITQSTEMLSQGGTFEEAFIMMKLTERFVQECYRLNFVVELPYNFLGTIDSHPIEFLYSGGYADIYRFMVYDPNLFWKTYRFLADLDIVDLDSADLSIQWDMSSRISGGAKDLRNKWLEVVNKLPENVMWTIKNNKLGNSRLNLLWYLLKLGDRTFYSSLVNEPSPRRFARMFGSGAYRQIMTKTQQRLSVSKLGLALSNIGSTDLSTEPIPQIKNFLDFCCRDLKFFYDSIEGADFELIEVSSKTEKPVIFQQSLGVLGNLDISASEFVSYVREPNGFKLLGKRSNPAREVSKLMTHLNLLGADTDECSNDQLYTMARKLTRDEQKSYRLIMPMPGDKRVLDSYTDAVSALCYNSLKWKRIMIRARSAAVIDWNRKLMQTVLPRSVTSYLECYWFSDLIHKYGVEEKDIYKEDFQLHYQGIKNSVPEEWRPILNAEVKPSNVLSEMPYWCCWTQEQVKLGRKWYGSGECFISVPEAMFRIDISGGNINKICAEVSNFGVFSAATSWYLSIFFSYSNLTVERIPGAFAPQNTRVLGFNTQTQTFGIGWGKNFDWFFDKLCFQENVTPLFSTRELQYVQNGNKIIYKDKDMSYKVYFFIPLEQPTIVDVAKFLDKTKCKEAVLKGDDQILIFINEVASAVLGKSVVDKEELLDNLNSSLIYNIVYNFSERSSVLNGDFVQLPFYRAMCEWKSSHPGFGFPDSDELNKLAKSGDMNPLSPKVADLLNLLGKTNLNQLEFESVVTKVLIMPEEERVQSILAMYPNLSEEHKIGSLVILQKSTRLFDSCVYIPMKGVSLLAEFFEVLIDAVVSGNISSPLLSHFVLQVRLSSGNMSLPDILGIVLSQIFIESYPVGKTTGATFKSQKIVMEIISELLDNGLAQWLNITSTKSSLFRTVEFHVEKDVILHFVSDLSDNLYRMKEFEPNVVNNFFSLEKASRKRRTPIPFFNDWSSMKRYILRSKFPEPSESLTINLKTKNGKNKLKRRNSKDPNKLNLNMLFKKRYVPGLCSVKFCPMDTDSEDDFLYCWEYERGTEDFTFEPKKQIKEWAYINSSNISYNELTRVRGEAWNVIISGFHVSECIREVHDPVVLFKRRRSDQETFPANLRSDIFLAVTGPRCKSVSIDGYIKLAWEETVKLFAPHRLAYETTLVEGKQVKKLDLFSNAVLRSKLLTIESYFINMSNLSVQKEVESTNKVIKTISENLFLSDNLKNELDELNSRIELYKESQKGNDKEELECKDEEKIEEEKDNIIEISQGKLSMSNALADIFNNQKDFLDKIQKEFTGTTADETKVLFTNRENTSVRFKDPLELITDEVLKSEQESLFPGYWELITMKKISMSHDRKRRRLRQARDRIANMSGEMKERHTMIYYIVSSILGELPERGGIKHMSDSFALHIDDLFYMEEETSDEGLSLPYTILPQQPKRMLPDMSFLD